MGVKQKVIPDGQPPTVAFTVFAQLCGSKANETEMGAALFTKNGEGSNLTLAFDCAIARTNWVRSPLEANSKLSSRKLARNAHSAFHPFEVGVLVPGNSGVTSVLAIRMTPSNIPQSKRLSTISSAPNCGLT